MKKLTLSLIFVFLFLVSSISVSAVYITDDIGVVLSNSDPSQTAINGYNITVINNSILVNVTIASSCTANTCYVLNSTGKSTTALMPILYNGSCINMNYTLYSTEQYFVGANGNASTYTNRYVASGTPVTKTLVKFVNGSNGGGLGANFASTIQSLTLSTPLPIIYINFVSPSESGTTKYLPNNYILVNYTLNINNHTNSTLYLYNSTGLYQQIDTTNDTVFVNFTVPLTNDTYYYNVTARNTTNQSINSLTYTNYISYGNLNITAKNYTGGTITNFSVLVNSIQYNTTLGYINYPTVLQNNYTVILLGNYNYTSANVHIDNSSQNLIFNTYPSNSINITTYSELTNTLLIQNFNLNFIGLTYQFNYSLTNGNAFIQNIPSDIYTISFTNTNYSTRSYVVTINSSVSQVLNAYIGNGSSIGMYVYDYSNVPLIAVINIQKLFGYGYNTVAQATTDLTGYASLPLQDGTIYQITITSTGFVTKTATFTPYLANSPYTFKLTSSTTTPFISPNYYVSYNIFPNVTYLNHTNVTFGIQLSSPQGYIQYANITCKGQNSYVTGSPNGLIAQVIVDLSGYNGLVNCQYQYLLTGYFPITLSRTYYVTSYDMTQNNTALSGLNNFVQENNNDAWTIIVGMFILLTITVLMYQITQNPTISTVAVLIGTLVLGFTGMFPMSISLFVVVISIGWLYFSQRY